MYCPWKTILPPKPKLSRLTLWPSMGTCSSLFADVQAKLAAQLQEGSADRPPRSSNNHQYRGPCPPRKRSRHTLTSRSSIRTLSFCLQHLQDEQAQTSLQQENGAVKSISRPKKNRCLSGIVLVRSARGGSFLTVPKIGAGKRTKYIGVKSGMFSAESKFFLLPKTRRRFEKLFIFER